MSLSVCLPHSLPLVGPIGYTQILSKAHFTTAIHAGGHTHTAQQEHLNAVSPRFQTESNLEREKQLLNLIKYNLIRRVLTCVYIVILCVFFAATAATPP